MSPTKQLLTYPGLKALPVATHKDIWPKCAVVKDEFWKIANEDGMEAQPSIEQSSNSSGGNISSAQNTAFMDDKEGKGILINP